MRNEVEYSDTKHKGATKDQKIGWNPKSYLLLRAHRYIETLQKNAVEKSHMCFPDVCVPTKTPCPWKDVNSASHAASVGFNQQQIAR